MGGVALTDLLADGLWAYRLGQASFSMIFPATGVVLLVVGVRRRRAYRRWMNEDENRLLGPDQPLDDDLIARPSRPRGRGTGFIVVGAMVVLLGAAHVLSMFAPSRTPAAVGEVHVGQCITADSFGQRHLGAEPVDCSRADATLQLVSRGDGTATCPDGAREGTKYLALINSGRTQCYVPNLRVGQCYAFVDTFTPVDCTDHAANISVVRRFDGTAEAVECDAAAKTVTFRGSPRAYCFVAP